MLWFFMLLVCCDSYLTCEPGSFDKMGAGVACEKCPMGTFNTMMGSIYPMQLSLELFKPVTFSYISTPDKWPTYYGPGIANYPMYHGDGITLWCSSAVAECNYTNDIGSGIWPLGFTTRTLRALISASKDVKYCFHCDAGTFTSNIGSTECTACRPGQYNVSNIACEPCSTGSFSSATGSSTCTRCANGTYTSTVGMTTCDTCINGVSTMIRDGGKLTCVECASCAPMTVTFSQCTEREQPTCAICDTSGLYAAFPWKGKCVRYSETPGGMTQTPIGYFPLSILCNYTSNVFPTKKVIAFDADSMTGVDINQGNSFLTNMFVSCTPPPLGRRFKEWSAFQPRGSTVSCNTMADCANIQVPCDLDSSTECIGWNSTAKRGWYASEPGKCTPCPSNSSQSTCDWGEYRNLSDCMPDRHSRCFQCHGTLPPNAVWTVSRYPHYFDDDEPNPCDWDCDAGYFKDAETCKACIKPENSVFDNGPYISFGMIEPPPKICLDHLTCRYFGGIKQFGCAWKCPNGFELITSQIGDMKCVACPELACQPGEVAVFKDTCYKCQKCKDTVANAVYDAECGFACEAGFFKYNATYCKQCTKKSCQAGYYSGGCGESSDSTCLPCTSCPLGYGISDACSATSDTACVKCSTDLIPYSTYDADCSVICRAGYVMSSGQCKLCAVSDSSCIIGHKRADTCTADDLGCAQCPQLPTYNWCWVQGPAACMWDCAVNFTKMGSSCVQDSRKTTNPCTLKVFRPPDEIQPDTPKTQPDTPKTTQQITETPITTPRPESPFVTRETLTVANMTIFQCLCASSMVASEFSKLYQTPVYVLSCASATENVDCPDYTCQCQTGRKLLQADITYVTLVYVQWPQHIENTERTSYLQHAITNAVVLNANKVITDSKSLDYNSVMRPAFSTGDLVLLVVLILAFISCVVCCCTRSKKAPEPPTIPIHIGHTKGA